MTSVRGACDLGTKPLPVTFGGATTQPEGKTMAQSQYGTDYRSGSQKGTTGEFADKAREMGEQAYETAGDAAQKITETAKEYPIATVIAVACLAFLAGWALRGSKESRTDALLSQLGTYAQGAANYLPRSWR